MIQVQSPTNSQGLGRRVGLSRVLFAVLFLSFAVASVGRSAESIQFPDDELASESVLPVFDTPVSVRNRSVLTSHRFEIGPVGGLSLLEPFYNPLSFGLSFSYHLNESSAINVTGISFLSGLSNNAQNLNPIPNTTTNVNLQYAPAPKYVVFADYQYTAFYGKVSLGKDYVMNLSLYGLAGAGVIGVGDALKPNINFGLGQKFYLSPNFALRFDFRFVAYQGPDVLSKRLDTATGPVAASQFSEKTMYASMLSLGAVFLFPGL